MKQRPPARDTKICWEAVGLLLSFQTPSNRLRKRQCGIRNELIQGIDIHYVPKFSKLVQGIDLHYVPKFSKLVQGIDLPYVPKFSKLIQGIDLHYVPKFSKLVQGI
jgi:SPX domain protein involved in polyphosphate accumulation